MGEGSWSLFMEHFHVHNWDWGLYIYYQIHRCTGLLPGPLAYGEKIKAKRGYHWLPRGTELFPSLQLVDESPAWVLGLSFQNSTPYSWTAPGFYSLLPGFQSSHKGIFVHGWIPNYCCWEEDTMRDILFGQLADVTLTMYFLLFFF